MVWPSCRKVDEKIKQEAGLDCLEMFEVKNNLLIEKLCDNSDFEYIAVLFSMS